MTKIVDGVSIVNDGLIRNHDLSSQTTYIDKNARSNLKNQKPSVIWLTGISSAGKSTIANLLENKLHLQGYHTYLLDGDCIRQGLNNDLGFTDEDRTENIRRIAEVSKLMADAGLIVITAFISPFQDQRKFSRDLMEAGEFIEVFIDTPIEVAEARDVKGLYRKARLGELKNFTGIDSPYEVPINPECVIKTVEMSADQAAETIIQLLRKQRRVL